MLTDLNYALNQLKMWTASDNGDQVYRAMDAIRRCIAVAPEYETAYDAWIEANEPMPSDDELDAQLAAMDATMDHGCFEE